MAVSDETPNPPETLRLNLTSRAAERIAAFRQRQGHPEAWVSVSAAGLNGSRIAFGFALVEPGNLQAEELLLQGADDVYFVAPKSLRRQVVGSTVDADPLSGALTLEPPPADAEGGGELERVQQMLDQEINPAIAAHGGYISLLDISDGVAYVQMGGGCQGCGMAEVTLSQGVRLAIIERFPEIHAVVDTTDHALGTNPYYQASKK